MLQISDNIKINNQINETIKSYFKSIDTKIYLDKVSFQNLWDDLIRINSVLNVPSDVLITNENKTDLTKILSLNLQKSIELDLSIVGISSVYISKEPTKEQLMVSKVKNVFDSTFKWIVLLDYKFLQQEKIILFLNLYSPKEVDRDDIYDTLLSDLKSEFSDEIELIIQWQINWNSKEETIELDNLSSWQLDLSGSFESL